MNPGFAENGAPQLCAILSDAESGRDRGAAVEQLPTAHARQATPAALTQDIVHWSGRRVAATRAQRLEFRIGGDRDRERPDRRGAC